RPAEHYTRRATAGAHTARDQLAAAPARERGGAPIVRARSAPPHFEPPRGGIAALCARAPGAPRSGPGSPGRGGAERPSRAGLSRPLCRVPLADDAGDLPPELSTG